MLKHSKKLYSPLAVYAADILASELRRLSHVISLQSQQCIESCMVEAEICKVLLTKHIRATLAWKKKLL